MNKEVHKNVEQHLKKQKTEIRFSVSPGSGINRRRSDPGLFKQKHRGSIAERVNNKQENEIKINFDEKAWKYNEADGFWYYQAVVPVDGRTTALFDEITGITDQAGKPLKDFEDFQITLYQEAVQTEVTINGKPVKATDATGNYNSENAMKIWAEFDKKDNQQLIKR